jgi:hypothetical protein
VPTATRKLLLDVSATDMVNAPASRWSMCICSTTPCPRGRLPPILTGSTAFGGPTSGLEFWPKGLPPATFLLSHGPLWLGRRIASCAGVLMRRPLSDMFGPAFFDFVRGSQFSTAKQCRFACHTGNEDGCEARRTMSLPPTRWGNLGLHDPAQADCGLDRRGRPGVRPSAIWSDRKRLRRASTDDFMPAPHTTIMDVGI